MAYVRVHAVAGARRELITERKDGEFDIAVREPAERNLANRRIVSLIAQHYAVPPRHVRLVSGHRSPTKVLDVDFKK